MTSRVFRFEALDAWRGICALLVAMFHLDAFSHIYALSFLRHSYLFVDFFFVLSGFVITASYRAKLLAGFSSWQFMLLRLGRLYPLHIATLAALIAIELVRYRYVGFLGGRTQPKFTDAHSIEAIITNVLLIQSLGIHNMLTWNLPSWSISVEFYTYAVFAIALLLFRGRIYIFITFVLLVAPIILFRTVGTINTDYDFGIIRCLLGFFIGVVCYDLHLFIKRENGRLANNSVAFSVIELCSIGLVVLFVCYFGSGPLDLVAPWLFGIVVVIFSFEGGSISNVLKTRPLLLLGALSYSIYMVHMLVLVVMRDAGILIERKTGAVLFRQGYFGTEMWQGDFAYGILIFLVLVLSIATYNWIEQPGRKYSRKLGDRIFSPTAPSIVYQSSE